MNSKSLSESLSTIEVIGLIGRGMLCVASSIASMAVSIFVGLESLGSSMGAGTLAVSFKMASRVSSRLEGVSNVETVGN